jgi:hypothetical protein
MQFVYELAFLPPKRRFIYGLHRAISFKIKAVRYITLLSASFGFLITAVRSFNQTNIILNTLRHLIRGNYSRHHRCATMSEYGIGYSPWCNTHISVIWSYGRYFLHIRHRTQIKRLTQISLSYINEFPSHKTWLYILWNSFPSYVYYILYLNRNDTSQMVTYP